MHPSSATRRGFVAALHLGLVICISSPALQAQYDPSAPEPIPRLKGTLFLGGGGDLPVESYQRFVEMAGMDKAKIVVLAASGQAPANELLTVFAGHGAGADSGNPHGQEIAPLVRGQIALGGSTIA